MTVAVNVSPAQFKSRNLVPTVINALATSGLPASRLELEITELVLMQENEGAIAILQQFHELGIKVAMDDFGTGYSSLGYLRSFPFDRIKIDQSFIHDLSTKDRQRRDHPRRRRIKQQLGHQDHRRGRGDGRAVRDA